MKKPRKISTDKIEKQIKIEKKKKSSLINLSTILLLGKTKTRGVFRNLSNMMELLCENS